MHSTRTAPVFVRRRIVADVGAVRIFERGRGPESFMFYFPATNRYVSGFINVMGDIGAVLEPIVARVATR